MVTNSMYTVTDCTFTDNTALDFGGAALAQKSDALLTTWWGQNQNTGVSAPYVAMEAVVHSMHQHRPLYMRQPAASSGTSKWPLSVPLGAVCFSRWQSISGLKGSQRLPLSRAQSLLCAAARSKTTRTTASTEGEECFRFRQRHQSYTSNNVLS